ncbi:hypothetical protein [Streptomyces sp. NPDC050538]|uniref:hypothetical protein n=1 Tax=Streptomyces sp. NPDC050538 TaxID=3365627 RepID=UPI0037ACA7DA
MASGTEVAAPCWGDLRRSGGGLEAAGVAVDVGGDGAGHAAQLADTLGTWMTESKRSQP